MSIYRHIYVIHYGPIPRDEKDRTYDIHHIDGNHENNNPNNLTALSIQEHYNIHLAQYDFSACLKMSDRMKISVEEKSRLARQAALARVENGTHNFLDKEAAESSRIRGLQRAKEGTCPFLNGDNVRERVRNGTHHLLGGVIQSINSRKRVEEGTHNFLGGEIGRMNNNKRIEDGTHNFLGGDMQRTNAHQRVVDGVHPFLTPASYTCPNCGKIGKGGAMFRFHFDKCRTLLK